MYRKTWRDFLIETIKYCLRLVIPGLVALLYYQAGKMDLLSKLEIPTRKYPLTEMEMNNGK